MKKVKLDKRYAGYEAFKWGIDFYMGSRRKTETLAKFNLIRNWCTDIWSQSCEIENYLEFYHELKDTKNHGYVPNAHWAWKSSSENFKAWRIYLHTDEELALFVLRWGTV